MFILLIIDYIMCTLYYLYIILACYISTTVSLHSLCPALIMMQALNPLDNIRCIDIIPRSEAQRDMEICSGHPVSKWPRTQASSCSVSASYSEALTTAPRCAFCYWTEQPQGPCCVHPHTFTRCGDM